MLQSVVIALLNAKVGIVKSSSVDGKIHKVPQVNVTTVTAEPCVVGSVKQRQKVVGMIADGKRFFCAESVLPTSGEFVDFFKVQDDNTILLLGSISAIADGTELYVDCPVASAWIDPVLAGGVLTIRQAHTTKQNKTILEVR